MKFYIMFGHILFRWVSVAEWPSFRKELSTRLTICLLCILTNCNFSLIFPVSVLRAGFGYPGHCLFVICSIDYVRGYF